MTGEEYARILLKTAETAAVTALREHKMEHPEDIVLQMIAKLEGAALALSLHKEGAHE